MVVDKDSGQFVDDVVSSDNRVVIPYGDVSDGGMFGVLAYVLIAFGAITIVIAFLGYCGAMRESQCMLATVTATGVTHTTITTAHSISTNSNMETRTVVT